MKIRQKFLCLVAAAALLSTLLAGCSAKPDPVQDVMGYKGSTVLFTVDGHNVTAADYLFWLTQAADKANQMYASFSEEGIPWDTDMGDGGTIDEYLKNDAMETAKLYALVEAQAAERGFDFTKEDQAAYEEQIASAIEEMGGQEAYDTWLKTMCLTADGMFKINRIGTLYSHLEEGLCREGGEIEATADKLQAYADENQLMVAKHILLATKDVTTGAALDEAAVQEKKAKAEDLAGQLAQSEDPVALFDELMKQNTEDPGLEQYPDGYVFGSGEMVEPFETAVTALEPGKISGVVESDLGYHVILRIAPADSAALKSQWEAEQVNALLQQWTTDAKVEKNQNFDDLTTKDFYEKLTTYRASLEETDEVNPGQEPGATPEAGQEPGATPEAGQEKPGDGNDKTTGDADASPQE